MEFRRRACWLLLLLPLAAPGEVEVSASVNATRIGADDTLVLTLTFKGVSDIGTPDLARLYDFRILRTSQQSEFQFVNGVSSSALHFLYVLAPKKTGTLIIPTFVFTFAGKEYRTRPFQIEVIPGSLGTQSQGRREQGNPFDWDDSFSPFRQSAPQAIDIRLKTSLSKNTILAGEQVVFSVFLYTVNQVEGISLLSKQSLPGFWQEWFPVPQQIRGRREVENGVSYQVFEIRKAALFPTQSGSLTIPPLNFQIDMADPGSMFFATRPVVRATPAIAIRVEPPAAGQAGLPVGRFTLSVRADKSQADINDLVSLSITLAGTGNIKALMVPLPVSSDLFTVYPAKISRATLYDQENLHGTVTAEVPLSFQKTGMAEIPPLTFLFIDPDSRKTVTLTSKPIAILVSGQKRQAEQARTMEQSAIVQKGVDIQFIASGRIADQRRPLARRAWALCLLVLPFAVNAALFLKRRLWDRWLTESAFLRKKRLLSRTLQALSRIDQHEEIASVLENYLAQRIGIGFSELSNQKIMDVLRAKGIPREAAEKLLLIKSNSEFSKFSPEKKSFRELQIDLDELKSIIRQLDRKLR